MKEPDKQKGPLIREAFRSLRCLNLIPYCGITLGTAPFSSPAPLWGVHPGRRQPAAAGEHLHRTPADERVILPICRKLPWRRPALNLIAPQPIGAHALPTGPPVDSPLQKAADAGEKDARAKARLQAGGRFRPGAVRKADPLDRRILQRLHRFLELRLAGEAEVRAAENGVNAVASRLLPDVTQNIRQTGMGAAEQHDQAALGPHRQRQIIHQGVRFLPVLADHDQTGVGGEKPLPARYFAAGVEARSDFGPAFDEGELGAQRFQVRLAKRQADEAPVAGGAPVAFAKQPRMGDHRHRPGAVQDLGQAAGVIVMAVAENDGAHLRKVLAEDPAVLGDGQSLPGIEKVRAMFGFHQTGEAVLPEQSHLRRNRIVAENGQACRHGCSPSADLSGKITANRGAGKFLLMIRFNGPEGPAVGKMSRRADKLMVGMALCMCYSVSLFPSHPLCTLKCDDLKNPGGFDVIVPVILSGGAGTRLWPLSRELYPKQLLPLVNEHTMLQDTLVRLRGAEGLGDPLVVCNESHRFLVAEQLRQVGIDPAAIFLEPVGRNTAPAVAVAALQVLAKDEDAVLLVLPADHAVADPAALCAAIEAGRQWAEAGQLITFGIVPTAPETGYGYIKAGKALGAGGNALTPRAVERFVEKPDIDTARRYTASGEYYWNSGMFMFRAAVFLRELESLAPAILTACRNAYAAASRDLDFTRLDAAAFAACPADSIDYAVMEKTAAAAVIPLDAGWSDVGSWSALWEIGPQGTDGNVTFGDVALEGAKNSYIYAGSRLVAAIGVEDQIIVETADAVLVAGKDRVQEVKSIVARLKAQNRSEATLHRKVFRPWGAYECIDAAERFQVKRITVNPGATLSLQMHHHRAEHWVVVRGTARITRGDEVLMLSENQSTYIPLGVSHRLENPGKITLELIEVQSGSYLGEDDIVRFEDSYGRS